jgi:hypothetical protein
LPPPPLVPLPLPQSTVITARAANAMVRPNPLRRGPLRHRRPIPLTTKIAATPLGDSHGAGIRRRSGYPSADPVVVMVSVTGTVVCEAVNATVAGLKLQLLCGGRLEHVEEESVAEPMNPLCALKVNTVDPDCPGLATLITVGLAPIVNGGGLKVAIVSTSVPAEVEPV